MKSDAVTTVSYTHLTSYNNCEVLPEYKEAFDQIPILSDTYSSHEVIIGQEDVYKRQTFVLSLPTINRTICGIISPTKPIIPVLATRAATMKELHTIRTKRTDLMFNPNA